MAVSGVMFADRIDWVDLKEDPTVDCGLEHRIEYVITQTIN